MHLLTKSKHELIMEISHLKNEINSLRARAISPMQPKHLVDFSSITPKNLNNSEENYKYLVEAINEVIYKINAEGYILYISPNIEKIFGYKSNEMIGHHILEYLGEENKETVSEKYSKLHHTGISLSEYLVPVQNGNKVWLRLSTRAIMENGKFVGAYGTLIDVSDKKSFEIALQKSEANARTILEANMDMIVLLTKEGIVLDTNENHAKRLKVTKEELLGKNVFNYLDTEIAKKRKEYINEAITKKKPIKKEDYRNNRWLETIIYPIIENDSTIEKVVVFARDITDRKNSELILQQNEQKLQELIATKDKFFSIISHDLRSPFNAILGFSELLNDNIQQKNFDDLEMYSSIIHKSAQHAYELLQNLLNWSRTQTGAIAFNPVKTDLLELINQIASASQEILIQKQLRLTTDFSNIKKLHIKADKEMIYTIIRNLLSNAMKFTPPGGTILITLSELKKSIQFCIQDSGVGIPENNILKLFKIEHSFSTKGTQNEAGTGLGLILCKEFVEKHNGTIWAESEEGKGSSIFFTLPLE